MTVQAVVTSGPASAVTAAEAEGAGVFQASDLDANVQSALDAAQSTIDGPYGWLGRCIGVQEIQMIVTGVYDGELELFPPVIAVTEVAHLATNGTATISAAGDYWLMLPKSSAPKLLFGTTAPIINRGESLRITYTAGYATVPPRIKQAIMLMARTMFLSSSASSTIGPLRSETIEGVGRLDYATMSGDVAAKYMDMTTTALLGGYRVRHL